MDLEPSRRRASLRASDADREQIVLALRQHHGDGRLTVSEFTERMSQAYDAKTLGDLDGLTGDLPPLPPQLPEEPLADSLSATRSRFYRHLLGYTLVNAFMILLWVITSAFAGRVVFFWPVWTLLGWGLALGTHAIRAFGPQDDQSLHGRDDRWDGRRDPWRRGPQDSRGRRSRSNVYW